jgi:hypothetical protein
MALPLDSSLVSTVVSQMWLKLEAPGICSLSDNKGCWKIITLESGIDVGQGINVGPGKLGKKNKRRALNTHVLCSE